MNAYTAVVNAILNAEDNGYKDDLEAMTDEQLADDLMSYDACCQDLPREQVLEAIRVFRLPY